MVLSAAPHLCPSAACEGLRPLQQARPPQAFLGLGTISDPSVKMTNMDQLPFHSISWAGIRSMSPTGFRAPGSPLYLCPLFISL